jgi:dihydrofolate reductase
MSRRLRYGVAVSLDGFIAGPDGEYDWIVMDPSIDFAAMFKEFDTAVMGPKTYEITLRLQQFSFASVHDHHRDGAAEAGVSSNRRGSA